ERGSADIREEPRPIANKRLDRIGDPIRPVMNHGSVRAGASCPARDPEPAPDGPASRSSGAPRSARCTPSAPAGRCSWRLPPCVATRVVRVPHLTYTDAGSVNPLLDVAEAPEVLLHLVGLVIADGRLVRVHPGDPVRGGFACHQLGVSA